MLGSNEATLTLVLRAKNAASKELGGLGKSLGGLNLGFGAVALGAAAFTGFLAESIKKAIEEQANIAKLNASLAANVEGWNGNTDAIEALIKTRENLAFSDDELRNSLAQIVAATHDVAKAQDIQSTAMDLARLKGISLEEASQALIRVEGGQYRALKSLGIVLEAGATQQDALNAVTKVANGQAAAYADTVGGKMLTAQIKLDDAMEDFGRVTMPLVTEAVRDLTLALDQNALSYEEIKRGAEHGSYGAIAALHRLDTATVHLGKDIDDTTQHLKLLANAPKGKHLPAWLGARIGQASVLAATLGAAVTNVEQLAAGPTNPGTGHAVGKHAAGGWVGLNGPEIALVGEKGPEYIVPNHQLGSGSMSGVTIVGVSERQILDMVERGLYFRLRRAAPSIAAR